MAHQAVSINTHVWGDAIVGGMAQLAQQIYLLYINMFIHRARLVSMDELIWERGTTAPPPPIQHIHASHMGLAIRTMR